jgi:hypothetical protein
MWPRLLYRCGKQLCSRKKALGRWPDNYSTLFKNAKDLLLKVKNTEYVRIYKLPISDERLKNATEDFASVCKLAHVDEFALNELLAQDQYPSNAVL